MKKFNVKFNGGYGLDVSKWYGSSSLAVADVRRQMGSPQMGPK